MLGPTSIHKCNIIKYGINNKDTNFYADNISFDNDGFPSFDVFKNNEFYCTIKLSVPGKHNILNALACTCLCDYYGIDKKSIENALSKFTGADRRFEFKMEKLMVLVYMMIMVIIQQK